MASTTYPEDAAFPNAIDGAMGLTKREHFAAIALSGLLANPMSCSPTVFFEPQKTEPPFPIGFQITSDLQMARLAVRFADALIAELNVEPNQGESEKR